MAAIQRVERRATVKIKGRKREVVREQYLRPDISCQSSLCNECSTERKLNKLPKDTTHYLVPFMDVSMNYLEVLEFPELRGIIFPQTVILKAIYDRGKSLVNKFHKILSDPRKECISFLNENCSDTYLPRYDNEGLEQWQNRSIFKIATWYAQHLQHRISIVMITTKEDLIKTYENEAVDVYVISLQQYLKEFWSDLTIAHDIYDSLTALLAMGPILDSFNGFRDYFLGDVLETGLKNGFYHEGKLKVSKYHARDEAFVVTNSGESEEINKQDVLIFGIKDRNRAIHGDLVFVEIFPKSLWKGKLKSLGNSEKSDSTKESFSEVMPTGRIVGIKQRNWRDYVACLPPEENFSKKQAQDRILVIPFDYRIPKIRILTRQATSLENCRIVVRIDFWDVNSQYPSGHFVRSLGKIGDVETESMVLMVENCINILPFPSRVNDEMPDATAYLEVASRRDLRNSHLICSIDPKECEDVDDALSIKTLPNGLIELGVHIADVTNYVVPNSFTDLEARARATTVYLAEKRYDMLPSVLSSNLCSLLSCVDRYAVSILWTLNKNCQVVDAWFGRTIIKSSYKLFYELAQDIILNESTENFIEQCDEIKNSSTEEINERFPILREALINLSQVAHILKTKRIQKGALELESQEVLFEFEGVDKAQVSNVKAKQSLDIHDTVAECMIFANQWVAEKIHECFPTHALLRRHPEPRQEQFEYLRLLAQFKGVEFNSTTNKELADSLERFTDPNDPFVNKIIRSLAIHAMKPATYFSTGSTSSDQFVHYGLALNYYTHFTSPIRRYADILVHRLLLAIADDDLDSSGIVGNKALQEMCEHINEKHVAAKHVQQQSQALFQAIYFNTLESNDNRRITGAIIYAVRSNGVLVYVPLYGIKGPVYLINKDLHLAYVQQKGVEWMPGAVNFDKYKITITVPGCGIQSYKLFEHITVCIVVSNSVAHAPTISLDLVNNIPHPDLKTSSHESQQNRNSQITLPITDNSVEEIKEARTTKCVKSNEGSLYMVIENLRDLSLQTVDS